MRFTLGESDHRPTGQVNEEKNLPQVTEFGCGGKTDPTRDHAQLV